MNHDAASEALGPHAAREAVEPRGKPGSDDQFSRVEMLIGEAGVKRLATSRVVVAGLGAVGSFAVEALARSGIGHLRLVDFDCVEPSNINRQLYALHSTLTLPKAKLAALRVNDISPSCQVESLEERINSENIFSFLNPRPDVVVDAIDTVCDKVSLLWACLSHGIPIVSSMGAARRFDPTCVRVGAIEAIHGCPLAKKVRKGLIQFGFDGNSMGKGLRCVYSIEPAMAQVMRINPGKAPFRAMGSSICVTGVFGLVMAREALRCLLDESAT